MGDFGMATSQENYDVRDSADRFKIFSSSFQTLKIYQTYNVTTTVPEEGADDNIITINHNLGYYAPFIIMHNGTGSSTFSYFNAERFPDGSVGDIDAEQTTNTLTISVSEFMGTPGQTVYYTVYIFVDNFDTVSESSINTTTDSSSFGNDYGIKVSKEGFDVKDASPDELIFSSAFFNQVVHKKGVATADVSHSLGYIPNFLAYTRATGNSYITLANIFDTAGNIDDSNLYIGNADNLYYIIFKNRLAA